MARPACALLAIAMGALPARSQGSPTDTLRLGALHDRALAGDPRHRQRALLAEQSALRLGNLTGELRPALALEGQAQYQSDVARIPVALPGAPVPPHDTYDARLVATQRLHDPGIRARRSVETAQLAHDQSRLRASLHGVRQQVNDAFFAALLAQGQIAVLRNAITGLEAQLSVAAARVREGSALPSEERVIRAELLRRQQVLLEAEINRSSAVLVLADLTGIPVDSASVLAEPDLAARAVEARAAIGADLRARPEYEQFAALRALLARQEEARAAQDRPRVSAFGGAGYGRPGLNPLNDQFDAYWLAGIQLQWAPWSWGGGRRDREILAVQRRIAASEEEAFTEQLRRVVTTDLAAITRLEAALRSDDEIIALREGIADEMRVRFSEAAVTSAEFVDRQTDLLNARLTRALHRVELAQARARLITTLGMEVR